MLIGNQSPVTCSLFSQPLKAFYTKGPLLMTMTQQPQTVSRLLTIIKRTALVMSLMVGNLSPSYAANCEADLKPFYSCTATFDTGGSVNYCVAVDYSPRTDGEFLMVADTTYYASCTCKASGTPPQVK